MDCCTSSKNPTMVVPNASSMADNVFRLGLVRSRSISEMVACATPDRCASSLTVSFRRERSSLMWRPILGMDSIMNKKYGLKKRVLLSDLNRVNQLKNKKARARFPSGRDKFICFWLIYCPTCIYPRWRPPLVIEKSDLL